MPGYKFSRWRLFVPLLAMLLSLAGSLVVVLIRSDGVGMAKSMETQTFPINARAKVQVTNNNGQVRIHSGLTNTVIVRSVKHSSAEKPDFNATNVNVTSGNRDTIIVDVQDKELKSAASQQVDLDITVPAIADFTVSTVSGLVIVDGVKGNMNVQTQTGVITAQNIRSDGRIAFQTQDGSIDIDNVEGPTSLMTASGHIEVADANLSGQSLLQTTSGKIAFDGDIDSYGKYDFVTSSGSVDISLSPSTAFELHTSVKNGSVNNEFDSDSVGVSPRAVLNISSLDGDIDVSQND